MTRLIPCAQYHLSLMAVSTNLQQSNRQVPVELCFIVEPVVCVKQIACEFSHTLLHKAQNPLSGRWSMSMTSGELNSEYQLK